MKNIIHKIESLSAVCVMFLCSFCCPVWAKAVKTPEERLQASVAREVKMGKEVAKEVEESMKVIQDPFLTARVRAIFSRLTPHVTRPLPYNVQIVREESPNAFCIPGGNIYITTGFLESSGTRRIVDPKKALASEPQKPRGSPDSADKKTKKSGKRGRKARENVRTVVRDASSVRLASDAEIAAVLAHELVHADKKHVIIQMERNQKLSLAALAAIIASKGAAAAVALSTLATTAMANSYSRDLEQQADLGAFEIMTRAGYDPSALITVMERFASEEIKMPWVNPGIARDHPEIHDRISYLVETLHAHGYKVHRKGPLKLLRPTLVRDGQSNTLRLMLDRTLIVQGTATPEFRNALVAACDVLEQNFQMETRPYDVRVVQLANPAVLIGNQKVFQWPLNGAKASPETVRARLLEALSKACARHPATNYVP